MTRVLIVDDEPQILRALRINLQARRYDVVTAADGAEALHAAAAQKPDLVVLDFGLPDIGFSGRPAGQSPATNRTVLQPRRRSPASSASRLRTWGAVTS
jgi:CheY-like chemotaxis protein